MLAELQNKGKNMNSHKLINNFLSKEECLYFIKYFNDNRDLIDGNHISEINQDKKFLNVVDRIKKEIKNVYSQKNPNPVYAESWIAEHVAGTNMPVHTDYADGYEFAYTATIYLNEDYTGGQIYFPLAGIQIQPETGDLVLFIPKEADAEHGVQTVTFGTRYAIPVWFNE